MKQDTLPMATAPCESTYGFCQRSTFVLAAM